MNTFVPYTSLKACAKILDNKRLNKQVSECGQMLRVLERLDNGEVKVPWMHHPAIKMWRGYNNTLFLYMRACETERLSRGMNPHAEMKKFPHYENIQTYKLPPWWGGHIHESHRNVLIAKELGIPREDYKVLYFWPKNI